MKEKCEKAEREKSDILLRRLASLDTTPTSRTTASEVKINHYKIKVIIKIIKSVVLVVEAPTKSQRFEIYM